MTASNYKRLKYLLDQCLQGTETPDEREELDNLLSDGDTMEHLDGSMVDLFFQPKELIDMPLERREQILEAIYSVEPVVRKLNNYRFLKWGSVAALFLGILFSTLWFGKEKKVFNHKGTYSSQIEEKIVKRTEDSAGEIENNNQTILKLTNGSEVELEKLDTGRVFEKNGVNLKRTSDGTLIINLKSIPGQGKYASNLNTITTPRGRTYKVVLEDGTVVHLNADSKLSFPSKFGSEERCVNFEGEGYFDVAKDKSRQFIVSTNLGKKQQEILVYGTQFNISAFRDDQSIKTTLIEGSVRIRSLINKQEILMKPNELVILNNAGMSKQSAELESSLAWRDNYFYFANLPLENVLKQISRWYDIEVSYQGSVPKENVWGQISRKKSLKEVLEILEKSNHIKFQQKGKEVTVMH